MRCSLRASLLSPLAQRVAPFLLQHLFSPPARGLLPPIRCGRGPQEAGEGVGQAQSGTLSWSQGLPLNRPPLAL